MNEEQKEAASLHGRYVVDKNGKIVGRISVSTLLFEPRGEVYAFLCSNIVRGSKTAANKLGYTQSYALVRLCNAGEGLLNRLLSSNFYLHLANENITLYDLI